MLEHRKNKSSGSSFNYNIKQQGFYDKQALTAFITFTVVYLFQQFLAMMTFYYAELAGINAGVISTVWSANPFFLAVLDYVIYKQKLTKFHIIGMVLLMLCAIFVSLASVIEPEPVFVENIGTQSVVKISAGLPILFAILSPITFATSSMLIKYMANVKAMPVSLVSFTSFTIVNTLLMIAGIIYWATTDFNQGVFWIGLVGSIINNLAIVLIGYTLSIGPAGPVAAITTVQTIILTVIMALIQAKVPKSFEILGLILGLLGALVLSIPEFMAKVFRGLFCCQCQEQEE